MDWTEHVDALGKVLAKHFPDAPESDLKNWAETIRREFGVAVAFQNIERSDKRPEKDIAKLQSAAKSLEKAAASLRESGWHGGKALTTVAQHFAPGASIYPHGSNTLAAPALAELLAELSKDILAAAERIPPNAASVSSAFSEGVEDEYAGEKTHRKIAASRVSDSCAEAYAELTGRKPGTSWDDAKGDSSGPLIPFIADVFSALGFAPGDSARNQAKEAAKRYNNRQAD